MTFWRWLSAYPHPEGAIFPGITAALLLLVSFVVVRGRGITVPRAIRYFHWLMAVVAVFFGLRALGAWLAPWQVNIFGMTISNTHFGYPLRMTVYGGILWIVTSSRFAGAVTRRSALVFYLVAAFAIWTLCLGPEPLFFGHNTPFPGPYTYLL